MTTQLTTIKFISPLDNIISLKNFEGEAFWVCIENLIKNPNSDAQLYLEQNIELIKNQFKNICSRVDRNIIETMSVFVNNSRELKKNITSLQFVIRNCSPTLLQMFNSFVGKSACNCNGNGYKSSCRNISCPFNIHLWLNIVQNVHAVPFIKKYLNDCNIQLNEMIKKGTNKDNNIIYTWLIQDMTSLFKILLNDLNSQILECIQIMMNIEPLNPHLTRILAISPPTLFKLPYIFQKT